MAESAWDSPGMNIFFNAVTLPLEDKERSQPRSASEVGTESGDACPQA